MIDTEIAALEAELRAAQLASDVDALDRLISEHLLFTGPDGGLATKADDLTAYRDGIMRVTSHEPQDLRVRRVGADVAVVALRTRLAGATPGHPSTASCATRASGHERMDSGVSSAAT